jgi:uncharacterized protein
MLLVDSNVWLDAADVDCPTHKACAALLRDRKRELVTPADVVGEASRLIRFKLGAAAEAAYVRLVTAGPITIVDLIKDDWVRARELVETYVDRPLGLVDAAIIAISERMDIADLASMNGRDFYLVRPKHTTGFTLLPEGLARPPRTA